MLELIMSLFNTTAENWQMILSNTGVSLYIVLASTLLS